MVGNLTIGTYTVKNLAYDKETNSFSRDYSSDDLKVYLKSEGGMMSLDKNYAFESPSKIIVKLDENGTLIITNSYKLAHMPLSISATYTGKKAK